MTDMDGNVVCSNDYLPYGDIRRGDCTENDENYGFTGKEKDTETGLIYYGARYYDPVIGRFVSMDPWEGDLLDPQTFNKYSYALNNPIRFIDPTGLYIMESGEVEKGDTLSGITDQLNTHYGTDYNYNDIAKINNISDPDKIQTGAIIRIGTPDGWQPSDKPVFGEKHWNSLTMQQQKIMNIHKNFYQSGLPDSNGQLNTDEWYRVPGDAAAHNIGTSGNADYRGKGARSGQQAIYDKNGDLVTSPENMGTFDLAPPKLGSYSSHLRIDVRPWLESGNSPADTTTYGQRVDAMSKTVTGRAALIYFSILKHIGK